MGAEELDCRIMTLFSIDPLYFPIQMSELEVPSWCISDDAFFQALEFAVVERELIQAAGRARLLDNNGEVHLFSNYVLSGGELWLKAGRRRF